jgi:hypothetical protein
MSEAPTFHEMWRLQWVEDRTLKDWQEQGVLLRTPKQIETLLNDAAARGFERGEQAGRFNLRRDIEAGTVEPITASRQQSKGEG